jgi:GC-rich sequence DNA-binding factor
MRIALGKKAKKAEADKVREEMQDLIADALVYIVPHPNSLLTYSIREDVDEETQEWEQAQFRRSGLQPDDSLSTPAAASAYKATPSMPPSLN